LPFCWVRAHRKSPLHQICEKLKVKELACLDLNELCQIKGIGPAKATIILAAAEFSRRVESKSNGISRRKCLCRFSETFTFGRSAVAVLLSPAQRSKGSSRLRRSRQLIARHHLADGTRDQSRCTRLLLGRNGWPVFSNTEGRYLQKLQAACAALNIICEGLMAVGPERFKMI